MRKTTTQPTFKAPPRLVEAAREAGLIRDPQEPIKVYGNMLTDVEIIDSELKTLLFAGDDYMSKLRVIRGASKRLMDRCAALMGEK